MSRRVLSVVVGVLAGFVVISLVEGFSNLIFPPPSGFDLSDLESLQAFVAALPVGALLLVIVAHSAGSFTAGLTCVSLSRDGWVRGAVITGAILMAAGIFNLISVSHPVWFAVLDVIVYLPAAHLGGRVHIILFPPDLSETTDEKADENR